MVATHPHIEWLVFLIVLTQAGFTLGRPVTFEHVTAAAELDYIHSSLDPKGTSVLLRVVGGAAAGDLNNGGWVDLYVTRAGAANLLFRNLADGAFEQRGAPAGVDVVASSSSCAWGDVDDDGDLDLYVQSIDSGGRATNVTAQLDMRRDEIAVETGN